MINWVESIGLGIRSIIEKIKEAEQRIATLEQELIRLEILNNTPTIDKKKVVALIKSKKHQLFSANEEEKKQVLQEYVDLIVIRPSESLNQFGAEVKYRVFSGGGELTLFKTLSAASGNKKHQGYCI